MTVAEEFETGSDLSFFGVRFRPGGAAALLGIHSRDYRDAVVPFETVTGEGKRRPVNRLEAFLLARREHADTDSDGFIRFFQRFT